MNPATQAGSVVVERKGSKTGGIPGLVVRYGQIRIDVTHPCPHGRTFTLVLLVFEKDPLKSEEGSFPANRSRKALIGCGRITHQDQAHTLQPRRGRQHF